MLSSSTYLPCLTRQSSDLMIEKEDFPSRWCQGRTLPIRSIFVHSVEHEMSLPMNPSVKEAKMIDDRSSKQMLPIEYSSSCFAFAMIIRKESRHLLSSRSLVFKCEIESSSVKSSANQIDSVQNKQIEVKSVKGVITIFDLFFSSLQIHFQSMRKTSESYLIDDNCVRICFEQSD